MVLEKFSAKKQTQKMLPQFLGPFSTDRHEVAYELIGRRIYQKAMGSAQE
jgi:hypothetical protein|tara:strand:- start:85 stop:234 length:150 start_codon:yes stop_codon:yes gene_type:complete